MKIDIQKNWQPLIISRLKLVIVFTLLFSSCSEDLFSPNKNKDTDKPNPRVTTSSFSCSGFTHIKPQVDFLFLWDNSTSSVFINSQTKQALDNTIELISNRFDYHILLAPLLGNGNDNAFLVSETPDNLTQDALNMKVDRSVASSKLSNFSPVSGNSENGVERVREMLSINISNGVFRQGAYTIIVVMSNEDDNSWVVGSQPTGFDRNNYIKPEIRADSLPKG